MRRVFLLLALVVLVPKQAFCSAEIEELGARLEVQRVAIEHDRKTLNADCAAVSSNDVLMLGECRRRHDDVALRMAQYSADLKRLKALKAAAPVMRCEDLAASLERLESGVQRAESVIAKNEAFIRQAEADKREAVNDAVQTTGEAAGSFAADALQDRLANFITARKNLQYMKKGLDELEKVAFLRDNARKLSPGQIKEAREWVDKGLKYSGIVADLTSMEQQYVAAQRNTHAPDPTLGAKLTRALKDFNDKFMYDAGGWEFAGENLAEFGGGPVGRLAFQSAVIGIKLEFAAAGYLLSDVNLAEYRRNQDVMRTEVGKLRQKIASLRSAMTTRHCPQH